MVVLSGSCNILLKQMEKHNWQRVTLERNTREPAPRWGHCSLVLGEEIIFFGGYADSNYMNDLWSFHTTLMTWTEHKTTGTIPYLRSNCTIHYDTVSRKIVVFGGGGSNKRRFNAVSLLDWETKVWSEIDPRENEAAPWERTYHTSEILYPYLIVYGGEGVTDLDDLWAFHLQTHRWQEILIDQDRLKPCARRFHSSVLIGSEFYVIAGCHGKYRCLSDIFSIDLASFLATGKMGGLQWKQLRLKGSSFLTRWGHTSTVYDGKIYVFGGRFSSDLQDILVVDPIKETLRTLKVGGDLPKARRRHSSVFVGSCMVVFGGFNGQYFNDLYYINAFDLKSKLDIEPSVKDTALLGWVNRSLMADFHVKCTEGRSFSLHKGLIVDRFRTQLEMNDFLNSLQDKYTFFELSNIAEILYTGVGKLMEELQEFDVMLHDSTSDRDNALRRTISPDLYEEGSLIPKARNSLPVIQLEGQKYSEYLQGNFQKFHDLVIILNQEYCLPANKAQLAVSSRYFSNLLKEQVGPHLELNLEDGDARVLQVLLGYLQTDLVIVPEGLDEQCWAALHQLAHYFCLKRLMNICEQQLINIIATHNCESLLEYSIEKDLSVLSLHSGEALFRKKLEEEQGQSLMKLKEKTDKSRKEEKLEAITQLLRFDMLQTSIKKERSVQQGKNHGSQNCEKENEVFL